MPIKAFAKIATPRIDLGDVEIMTVITKEINGREYKTRILSGVK
jgi:hypothetical protein